MSMKAWSFAETPFFLRNPRKPLPLAPANLLQYDHALAQLHTILDSPTPWKYVDDGFVLYEGPSLIDGGPIVAIVTGVGSDKSANVKTGTMLQTWILRTDVSPQTAVDTGLDYSICGDCPARGRIAQDPKPVTRRTLTAAQAGRGEMTGRPKLITPVRESRSCYVVVAQASQAIWKAYHRGNYPRLDRRELPLLGYGRVARIGSYGDPAAVPFAIWEGLTEAALGWTGYTHQWCDPRVAPLSRIVMASVDSEAELHHARSMGWRTFRVLKGSERLVAGLEIVCPASEEGGFRKTCDACRACQGAQPGKAGPGHKRRERRGVPSVAIRIHPHWQLLFDPKKRTVRGHKATEFPTKVDPKKKAHEVVLLDRIPQPDVRNYKRLAKHALKSADPAHLVTSVARQFPDYMQSQLQSMAKILGSARRPGHGVKKNPLLAIVGNPTSRGWARASGGSHGKYVIASYEEETECDWCGEPLFVGDSAVMPKSGRVYCCSSCLERGERQVAGAGHSGSVKSKKSKPKKNRTAGNGRKKKPPKTVVVGLEEAKKKFDGYDDAMHAYREFHKRAPHNVTVYEIDDGRSEVTTERVHTALHRTIDTNYFVPWESNKKGSLWKHEHVDGFDLAKSARKDIPPEEEFPLEILDPATGTTRKIAGKFVVRDWWHS